MKRSRRLIIEALAAASTSLVAQADVHATVTGTVTANTIASGPFAGAAVGAPVTVTMDLATPGTETNPGLSEVYDVDQGTFLFDVGGTSLPADPAASTLMFLDNLPTLDGFCIFTGVLDSPGYQYTLILRDSSGAMFTTTNVESLTGSYPASTFTTVIFNVQGGGGSLTVGLPLLVLDPPTLPPIGMSYCSPAVPNSTGLPARIEAFGSTLVFDNQLTLVASDIPPGQFGYFLAGLTQGGFTPPGSSGVLCLSGNIGRFNSAQQIVQGPTGSLDVHLSFIPVNPPTAVQPGDTWNFQCWHRDVGTSNFTDGVTITYQ